MDEALSSSHFFVVLVSVVVVLHLNDTVLVLNTTMGNYVRCQLLSKYLGLSNGSAECSARRGGGWGVTLSLVVDLMPTTNNSMHAIYIISSMRPVVGGKGKKIKYKFNPKQ